MAEKRGGRRVPGKPASYSGVGKNSKRTDGQPIRTPNVQDGTDLTQGDRATLEAGQRVQRIGRSPEPQMQPPPQGGGGGGIGGPGELPGFLAEMSDPNIPVTEGLDYGPGAGSEVLEPPQDDVRLLALERYARLYDNPDAKRMLNRVRQAAVPPSMPMPTAGPPPAGPETEIEPSLEFEAEEDETEDLPAEEVV